MYTADKGRKNFLGVALVLRSLSTEKPKILPEEQTKTKNNCNKNQGN